MIVPEDKRGLVLLGAGIFGTVLLGGLLPSGVLVAGWGVVTIVSGWFAWNATTQARAVAAFDREFGHDLEGVDTGVRAVLAQIGAPPGATVSVYLSTQSPPTVWAHRLGAPGGQSDVSALLGAQHRQDLADWAGVFGAVAQRAAVRGVPVLRRTVAYTDPRVGGLVACLEAREREIVSGLSDILDAQTMAVRVRGYDRRWDVLFVHEPVGFAQKEWVRAAVVECARAATQKAAAGWGRFAPYCLPALDLRWPPHKTTAAPKDGGGK